MRRSSSNALSLFGQEEVEYARIKQPWEKKIMQIRVIHQAETRNCQRTVLLHSTDLTIMRKDKTQKLPLVKIHFTHYWRNRNRKWLSTSFPQLRLPLGCPFWLSSAHHRLTYFRTSGSWCSFKPESLNPTFLCKCVWVRNTSFILSLGWYIGSREDFSEPELAGRTQGSPKEDLHCSCTDLLYIDRAL